MSKTTDLNSRLWRSPVHRAVVAALLLAPPAMFASPGALAQGTGGSVALEEIVVTARKVEEKLNDVPVAVSAFTAQALQDRNVTSLADIAALTPGFSFEAYSGGTTPAPRRGPALSGGDAATSSRRSCSKSTSISGGSFLADDINRSNRSSNLVGSTEVIPRQ